MVHDSPASPASPANLLTTYPAAPERVDVAVIGAGIVGLATALRLLQERPGLRVAVLEREAQVAAHQSGHNSGVVHAGLYYTPGSQKALLCVPYTVNIPYAILETNNEDVISLKEKPNLTYHSNAGIYLIKKEIVKTIPKNTFYNATDLIEQLITDHKKVIYYPIIGYWLDIGKMDDYKKAQEDIKHIKL